MASPATASKSPQGKSHDASVLLARSVADRRRIYALRYEVLVKDFGEVLPGTSHAARIVHDKLDDSATQLALEGANGELIAALRINPNAPLTLPKLLADALLLERFSEFPGNALAFTSGLAVAQRWRGSPVLSLLIGAAYKLARSQGVRFDFVTATPDALPLYERLGYRRYADNVVEAGTLRVPLVLLLEDVRYLKEVASPLWRLAFNENNPTHTALWFARAFPNAQRLGRQATSSDDEFWTYLSKQLGRAAAKGAPLFEGLTPAEVKQFVASGTTLRCQPGETVIRAGARGHEMYVILSGEVEVLSDDEACDVLAQLGTGEVFGEIGYLSEVRRTASVIARGEVEVLMLTQDYLRQVMDQSPEIAAKVLFNLSIILCSRLPGAEETICGPIV